MRDEACREILLAHPRGAVRIRSFCSPEEIAGYSFHHQFSSHNHYKSLYTQKDSLIRDASRSEANVVLALTSDDVIVGFGVLAYPDAGDRWFRLGSGQMIEVRVIEVSRNWRSGHLAARILELMLDHPQIEEKITYMVGYSWTWDLEGTGLNAQAYRQVLSNLFSAFDFQELETNEPNVCLKQENLFMCRLGRHVPEKIVEQFNWLRFGIATEPQDAFRQDHMAAAEPARVFSLFVPLAEENLTGLGIYFDWKHQRLSCRACRQWDDRVDWRGYPSEFSIDHPLIVDSLYLNHEQTMRLFERHGLGDYLEQIFAMLKKERHLGLLCFYNARQQIHFLHFMHRHPFDPTHIYHGRRAGGVRLYPLAAQESDLIGTGLDMSRSMSFKNAFAGLPFGGSATVIQARAEDLADPAGLRFLSYAFDRTHSLMMPDMGFSPDIINTMRRERYSAHVSGGSDGSVGSAGRLTAYGIFLSLKQTVAQCFGATHLAGRKVVVQGIGAVGRPLIEDHLISTAADLYVADTDRQAVEELMSRFPGRMHALDPADVLSFQGDILMPCARNGLLDQQWIEQSAFTMIIGATENIFKAETHDEEIRYARALDHKGIYFQPSWLHNSGGLIGAMAKYVHGRKADRAKVLGRIEQVCRDRVAENLSTARANGITPTEQAYRVLTEKVYGRS